MASFPPVVSRDGAPPPSTEKTIDPLQVKIDIALTILTVAALTLPCFVSWGWVATPILVTAELASLFII